MIDKSDLVLGSRICDGVVEWGFEEVVDTALLHLIFGGIVVQIIDLRSRFARCRLLMMKFGGMCVVRVVGLDEESGLVAEACFDDRRHGKT